MKFDLDTFKESFVVEFEKVLGEELIVSKEKDFISGGAWTIIFNTALYLYVKKYNKHHKPHLQIIIEPEARRGGFSDCRLHTFAGKNVIQIEHENKKGLAKNKKNLKKLMESKAKYGMLIWYMSKKSIEKLKSYKRKLEKRSEKKKKILLLTGPDNLKFAKQYVPEII